MSEYIPPELIPTILARLPSDDVLRCTSVCKSWYDIITSPSFTSSHLKHSSPNQESRLLVKHTNEAEQQFYNLYHDDQTCDKIADLNCQQVKGNFGIVGSFNGLLCLTEFNKKILLWNPSIRKLFILPKPRVIYPSPSIGFSYIPETNDYKIVRVSGDDPLDYQGGDPFLQVEIYELSKNSWHYIDVGDFSYQPVSGRIGSFLNGSLHWVAEVYNGVDFDRLIVSLDMKYEKFGTLMLPSCLGNSISCVTTVFKESLCAVQITDFSCNIWAMNEYGVADSWRMQFKVDTKEHGLSRPLYVRDNGQIVFTNIHRYLVSYDSRSNQVTNIGGCEKKVDPDVTCYMESLVLIKSSTQNQEEV
jgi:F-box interacting protein